jgi:pSer/pThr/pTyr-binding forkhead associated (FHA) protein
MAFVDAGGRLLPMDRDPIRVGRASDNDWSFNDPSVSNYHARIKKNTRGSGYEVEDLRSTNGTWVRERRIGGAETIAPGTRVRFGKIEVMLMTKAQSSG